MYSNAPQYLHEYHLTAAPKYMRVIIFRQS